jgi:hypothetical protein
MNEIKERSGSKKEKEHLIIKRKCGGLYIAPQVSSNSEGHPTPPLVYSEQKGKKAPAPQKSGLRSAKSKTAGHWVLLNK